METIIAKKTLTINNQTFKTEINKNPILNSLKTREITGLIDCFHIRYIINIDFSIEKYTFKKGLRNMDEIRDIVIIGTGGFAKEVGFLIEDINKIKVKFKIKGFIVSKENNDKIGERFWKYDVIGDDSWLLDKNISVAIGVGFPALITKIVNNYSELKNIDYPNLFHPSLIWDEERIKLGYGNIFCAGNVFTTDIEIGNHNVFNLNSTFGHDIKIKDCSVFNPCVSISGCVTIENSCLIGTGARILQNLTVHNNATIGAGSVVIRDVAAGKTVIGIPAKNLM